MMPHTEQMRDSGATSSRPPGAPPPAAFQSRLELREWRPRPERAAGLADRLPPAMGEAHEAGVPGCEEEPGSRPCARSRRRVCFTPCNQAQGQRRGAAVGAVRGHAKRQ